MNYSAVKYFGARSSSAEMILMKRFYDPGVGHHVD